MGNGKSATGNSILGRRAFQCHSGSSAVRATCELQQVQMNDGRQLNVIDTPGLFDPTVDPDFLGKEIARCIDLAKDGLHAVLFVLSVRNRYTPEEAAALETLQKFLGEKFLNYMVVIFTGGDELEANEQTLEDYLREIPPALQEILSQCNDRKVLFDNKTRSETVKEKQRSELLKQIDIVIAQNGGHPYSNEMFLEAQECPSRRKDIESGGYSKEQKQILPEKIENAHAEKLKSTELEWSSDKDIDSGRHPNEQIQNFLEKMKKANAEQLKKTTEMVEEKLRMATKTFERQLADEQAAREQDEKYLRENICMLQEKLRKLQAKVLNAEQSRCVIL
jgi:hypothetical protein